MAALGPFPISPHMAVAVSGGSDSMALCLLLADWVRSHGGQLTALTVDHGLRPESRAESLQVGIWLRARGIDHHILFWTGPKPASAIQATARQARYELMESWCRDRGVSFLAVGHQLEDQAETFLLRLGKGSGLDGLAGMAAKRRMGDVWLLRPLLGVSRARLKTTLAVGEQDFIQDPSNNNPTYERVRLRQLMAGMNLSAALIAQTSDTLAQARGSAEALVDHADRLLVSRHPFGFALLDGDGLADAPTEVGIRLLARVLRQIGGRPYPPNADRVLRLMTERRGTLAGCRVSARADGLLLVSRENRGVEALISVIPGGSVIWDRRFRITALAQCPPGALVGALGELGWKQVEKALGMRLPPSIRATLPAIWIDGKVVTIPRFGDKSGDKACIFTECDYFSLQALSYREADLHEGRNTL